MARPSGYYIVVGATEGVAGGLGLGCAFSAFVDGWGEDPFALAETFTRNTGRIRGPLATGRNTATFCIILAVQSYPCPKKREQQNDYF